MRKLIELIKWIMRILYHPKKKAGVIYGLLYNWTAATDVRGIASSGWALPTYNQMFTLVTYLDEDGINTSNNAGGYLKETGTTYWDSPNTGATNSAKFNGRGAGVRAANTGGFTSLKLFLRVTSSNNFAGAATFALSHNGDGFIYGAINVKTGLSVRLLKGSTSLSNGQTGTYTGNDGRVYSTICIGTQEWLSENLAETKYANDDIIPWYGADAADFFTAAEWAALTTAGVCAYDNNVSNVAPGFSFPT